MTPSLGKTVMTSSQAGGSSRSRFGYRRMVRPRYRSQLLSQRVLAFEQPAETILSLPMSLHQFKQLLDGVKSCVSGTTPRLSVSYTEMATLVTISLLATMKLTNPRETTRKEMMILRQYVKLENHKGLRGGNLDPQ